MASRVIGGEDGSRSGSNVTRNIIWRTEVSVLSFTTSWLGFGAFWMQLTTGVFPAMAAENDTIHLTWQDGREGAPVHRASAVKSNRVRRLSPFGNRQRVNAV